MAAIPYYHLDVFSAVPLAGNGLTVFPESAGFTDRLMQQLTQEMRQFESIFLTQETADVYRARIFTVEEELDYAGHPVLGAAVLLHELHRPKAATAGWQFRLNAGVVTVSTQRRGGAFWAVMAQEAAVFGEPLSESAAADVLQALNVSAADLAPGLPVQRVSTGLPYLLLPLRQGLDRARIGVPDLEARLAAHGAKFVGVLDVPTRRMRTWDNAGLVEDVATGSLAGPVGAYLVQHGQHPVGQPLPLYQGEFVGRPSQLNVEVRADVAGRLVAFVSGAVCLLAAGHLLPKLIALLNTDHAVEQRQVNES